MSLFKSVELFTQLANETDARNSLKGFYQYVSNCIKYEIECAFASVDRLFRRLCRLINVDRDKLQNALKQAISDCATLFQQFQIGYPPINKPCPFNQDAINQWMANQASNEEMKLFCVHPIRPVDNISPTAQLPQELRDSLKYFNSFLQEQSLIQAGVRMSRDQSANASSTACLQSSSGPSNSSLAH